MARSDPIEVTVDWQQLSVKVGIFTVAEHGKGVLLINDSPDDDSADRSTLAAGEQWMQNEVKPTWVRSDRLGWKITVDELG